jgi:hypothetical protein
LAFKPLLKPFNGRGLIHQRSFGNRFWGLLRIDGWGLAGVVGTGPGARDESIFGAGAVERASDSEIVWRGAAKSKTVQSTALHNASRIRGGGNFERVHPPAWLAAMLALVGLVSAVFDLPNAGHELGCGRKLETTRENQEAIHG